MKILEELCNSYNRRTLVIWHPLHVVPMLRHVYDRYSSSLLKSSLKFRMLVVVQSLSHVWLFATLSTAACQSALSSVVSQSLLIFMSIESLMLSNHLILCHPLLLLLSVFPSIRVFFTMSRLFTSGSQSIGASAVALLVNVQGWCPLGLTGLISNSMKSSELTVTKLQCLF